jgi:hypothetical protein
MDPVFSFPTANCFLAENRDGTSSHARRQRLSALTHSHSNERSHRSNKIPRLTARDRYYRLRQIVPYRHAPATTVAKLHQRMRTALPAYSTHLTGIRSWHSKHPSRNRVDPILVEKAAQHHTER